MKGLLLRGNLNDRLDRASKNIISFSDLLPSLFALLFWISGKMLLPVPTNIDASFSSLEFFGALSFFLFWLSGVLGWGLALGEWLGSSWRASSLCIAWGIAFEIAFAAVAGHMGWIGAGSSFLFTIFSFCGILIGIFPLKKIRDRRRSIKRNISFSELWPLWAALAVFVYLGSWFFLRASLPYFLSDAFWYHLLGPRLWFEAGRIYVDPRMPLSFQASYWEYLFIHGNALMADSGGRGLVETQLFGQWLHVFACLASTFFLATLLIRFRVPSAWSWLAATSGMVNSLQDFTIFQAKNDWGAGFLVFAGLFALSLSCNRKRLQIASGALFGIATGAKYTVALGGGPAAIAILWTITWRRNSGDRFAWSLFAKVFGRVATGFFIGIAPLILRNWILTDDPVFPALTGLFHSSFMSVYRVGAASFGFTALQALKTRFDVLLTNREYGLFVFFLISPFLLLLKSFWRIRPLLCATLFTWGFFLFFVGDWRDRDDGTHVMRLLGPAVPLAIGLMAVGAAELLRRFSQIGKARIISLGILVGFLFLPSILRDSDLRVFPHPLRNLQNFTITTRKMPLGGWNMAWLRLNASPSEPIVSTGFNFLYYVAHLNVASLLDDPGINEVLQRSSTGTEFLRALDAAGVVYLLDVPHFEGRYWSSAAFGFDMLTRSNPQVLAAISPNGGWIARVHDLLEAVESSCDAPREPEFELLHLKR